MPLQIEYRPQGFDEFYGNEEHIASLKSVLNRQKGPPHSFLFTGPAGSGKTTLAYILKSVLGIADEDFFEINGSAARGIKEIRTLLDNSTYLPMIGNHKMYFIDECHQVTHDAQEALLKQLEDPYKHVYWVLCTTEPEKLKDSFRRRPYKFLCKPFQMAEMTTLLEDILYSEEKENITKEVIEKIVDVSNGSAGVALNLLDTIIDMEDPAAALACISNLTHDKKAVIDISRTLCDPRIGYKQKWHKIKKILPNLEGNPESARRAILEYVGKVHIGESGNMQTLEMLGVLEKSIM